MNGNCKRRRRDGPRNRRWTMIGIGGLFLCACSPETQSPAAPPVAQQPSGTLAPSPIQTAAATAQPTVPAPAVTQASWAPDALEELLAPIALYPDTLLTQILAASVNAQEVLDGGNWLLENQNLKGNELDAAAQAAGFGPAMRALLQFPTVVDMMCQQIDWTRQLGSAFTSDQKSVLDAVQRLRAQAAEVGNLKSTPQQTVTTKTENDKVIVEVKPADPQIVYVPQYNPQVVYTTPPPATTTTTTTTQSDGITTGEAVATGLLAFGVGVLIGNAFDDDHCYPNWGYGAVYYGPRPFYPPAYVYRPVYGPAFRPAYRYAPPAGYRNAYNNVNIRNDVNINVNNSDYFNRFDNNRNLHVDGARSPLATQTTAANRAGQTAARNSSENWKGQSTYAGAKNPATAERLNQAAGERPAAGQARTGEARSGEMRTGERPVGGSDGTRNPAVAGTRDAAPTRAQYEDRGYGESTRVASRETLPETRPEPRQQPAGSGSSAARDNAFSGAQRPEGGSFERASSARGHASSGSRQNAQRGSRRR